ncbi:MAG: hypothetical protein H0Z39_10175 [Peptococcaceae bacterium]|nr:hypothetical protein [Peptococcaceae bacterium]
MRLIAIMPEQEQAGFLIDSLRNAGFDRKDMIVSDLAEVETQQKRDPAEKADDIAYLKTEREGLWEAGAFANFINEDDYDLGGIMVAVEVPRHEAARVREIMEQSGASKIMQD